ncbi:MAG: hypothetical protein ACK5SI_09110 [Planctomycetia bacterium]
MVHRQATPGHLLRGLVSAAILGGLPWAFVARAGDGQLPGCTQSGAGVAACGPGGCRPGHGCHHGGCRHGHCCHHGLCGQQVGGPCNWGYAGGLCGDKHGVYAHRYFLRSQGKSWHSGWYDPSEGRPIALVVPPTAEFQTQYGWGVPSSRVAPIYHQFRRPYPGPGAVGGAGAGFMPTPNIPSDTVQFGVNAVRGPWGSF